MFDVLLPDPMQVRCDDVSVLEENEEILLQLVANSDVSACPRCH